MDRDFKGIWIPKEVYLNKELNALDKIIFVEIDSLDSSERGCWASNKYLADFCLCSERKVSEAIAKLTKMGFIYCESFNGRERCLRSRFTKIAEQGSKNCEAEKQNLRQSNIENNIDNNKEISTNVDTKKTKRFVAPTIEEVEEYCRERGNSVDAQYFLDYYETRGWMIGKNHVKDWKACVRTWERNSKPKFNNNNAVALQNNNNPDWEF